MPITLTFTAPQDWGRVSRRGGNVWVVDDVVRVLTDEQWERATRQTGPSTPDDCSITRDGRRLDTAAKMIAYIEEYNRAQAADAPPPT